MGILVKASNNMSTRKMLLSLLVTLAIANQLAFARSYRKGSRLYLDNGTVRVGVETAWGGAIVEVSAQGKSLVNAFDPGREVQAAVYDGDPYPPCGDCAGGFGWNPVQGGDSHRHGSPLQTQSLTDDVIYTKASPIHWVPENKGGSPSQPVSSDIVIEQWVSLLTDIPSGIKVHYKITHTGTDEHTNSYQEFPAVYVNWDFGRFVYYGGTDPWTNGTVSFASLPNRGAGPTPTLYSPEQWAGFVDDQGFGLTVYVPGQYPYVTGSHVPQKIKESSCHNFLPRTYFSFGAGSILEADIYLFAADYRTARQAVYALHQNVPVHDAFTPLGSVDAPTRNAHLSGTTSVTGWAFDNVQVSSIDIFVDGRPAGHATYGSPRADVSKKWPHAPTDIGFRYSLDTTHYANGEHYLGVKAVDSSGNTAIFPRIPVVIENRSTAPPQ